MLTRTNGHSFDKQGTQPLLVVRGAPLVYPVLGARFYLEPLQREDSRGIREVSELLVQWLGPHLRQTNHSHLASMEPFVREHVDAFEAMVPATPEQSGPLSPVLEAVSADFSIDCNGGAEVTHASPFGCGCICTASWKETPTWTGENEVEVPEEHPEVLGYIDLHVPPSWPADDFRKRVLAIASCLRLRWATAGLTYATWLAYEVVEGPKTVYAHARRHPGFDVGYSAILPIWQNAIRTVNWLTLLGPELHRKAERYWRERFVTEGKVVVSKLGDNCVIQAGAEPEGGDLNRLDLPQAYIQADAMLRGIILSVPTGIVFPGPWDPSSVGDWLNRFRKHARPYART